jgi:subtilisin family serine protease
VDSVYQIGYPAALLSYGSIFVRFREAIVEDRRKLIGKSAAGRFAAALFLGLMMSFAVAVGVAHADDDGDDASGDFVDGQLVVKLNPDPLTGGGATIEEINRDYGTATKDKLLGSRGVYLLDLPGGSGTQLTEDRMDSDLRLLYAELDYIYEAPEGNPRYRARSDGAPATSSDPASYRSQSALDSLGVSEAHEVGEGNGAVVAILDTGVDQDHPELADALTDERYNYVNDNANPEDRGNGKDNDGDGLVDEMVGHGTHVAGIVRLVAPEAEIMPMRVLDSDGRGNSFVIAEAAMDAAKHGADVINMSFGSAYESDFLEDVIEDVSEDDGEGYEAVVVASAGNENSSANHYPAADDDLLSVASVDAADATKSEFSNFGEWISLSAPGEDIYSTYPGGRYAEWSGTSMAAPFVSGQAALVRGENPDIESDYVQDLIKETGYSIDAANPGYVEMLGRHMDPCASLGCGGTSGSNPTPAEASDDDDDDDDD